MPRRQAIAATDLYRVQMPGEVRASSKAGRIVATVSRIDEESLKTYSQLWVGPAETDTLTAELKPFTSGNHRDRHPRWSPDGTQIAFLSDRSGKSEIWIIDTGGGEARQLTKLEGSISSFDWHPKGRRLAVSFTAADPERKALAEAKKQGKPGSDEAKVITVDRLVYKMDGAGFLPKTRTHVWTVNAQTGKARQLLDDDTYEESSPSYSPDGKWIYFGSRRGPNPELDVLREEIWRIPARGGDPDRVRTFDGPAGNHSVSPDGKWLAFVGKPSGSGSWNSLHDKVYVTPATGGKPRELTETLDRSCENSSIGDVIDDSAPNTPVWSPDSEWVYFVAVNEGNTELWRVHRREARPQPVIQDPGVVLSFAIDFERGWIHYAWGDPANPGEVRSRPLPVAPSKVRLPRDVPGARSRGSGVVPEDAEVTRLPKDVHVRSRFNSWLDARRVGLPQEFWYEGKHGHALQGWVLHPPGFNKRRKYPAVLYIHGGPATQYARLFFHEFQVLAAKGFVVFYTNPRGGTGYSEAHLNSIVGKWGTLDYDDVMRFTDLVVRKYRTVDGRRVGVAGGSYGGFMTNWIIGHTHRFKCAITQRCLSNLLSFVGASDFGFIWPREFGEANPWDSPDRYLKMSPLTYLSNMKTPTLIEHQEDDHRCPIDQAEQLWSGLRAKGVPCEFIRYPGEPHGMSRMGRPDRRIDRLERIEGWLRKWLSK